MRVVVLKHVLGSSLFFILQLVTVFLVSLKAFTSGVLARLGDSKVTAESFTGTWMG